MKTAHTVKAKLGKDGRLRRVSAKGKFVAVLKGRADPRRLDTPAAFAADADTPILTRRQLRELRPVLVQETPDLASMRRRLRLSQGAFATLFGIPLATVKDWELGRRRPDAPSRAYLRVIAKDPEAVRRALVTGE